ncbi:uncharacterized protein K441DRAFT_629401 [Cenococcum geophilum 1.58]|uniref:uncharacterized protein n=1 Tax=Cenococcum geophilum 1.58 TaxID=794803 RepID=UPI00358E1367|nr:hypothetical protein K441DRAFT_629401 [Cenococcum geophilum 1.58]
MTSPIFNFKIISKSPAHILRALTIFTFPPAFIMLLIHGITSSRFNPAMGLLPLSASSAFGAAILCNEKECDCEPFSLIRSPILCIMDLILGVGLLVALIATWVTLPYHWNGSSVMLGTYGTNFLLINFLVHAYFVIQQLYELLPNIANRTTPCPQCNYSPLTPNAGRRHAKGYAPLVNNEEQEGCRDCKTVGEVAEQPEGPRDASKAGDALDLV